MPRHSRKLVLPLLLLLLGALRQVSAQTVSYAPPGQVISGFPLQLILDSSAVVVASEAHSKVGPVRQFENSDAARVDAKAQRFLIPLAVRRA